MAQANDETAMTAEHMRGPAITPERNVLDDPRARLGGPLLFPGDAGYDDERSVWNAMIDRRLAAIARCLGVADVMARVTAAREHSLPLGGGFGYLTRRYG